jgi:ABC-2 type transport system ATP-binding protein
MLFVSIKGRVEIKKILKVLSVILFAVYMVRLFSFDAINSTFNLMKIEQISVLVPENTWLFSVGESILILVLRWLTVCLVALAIVAPWFSEQVTRNILAYIGIPVCILNIIFFQSHIIAFLGTDFSFLSYRTIQYAAETILLFVICGLNLTIILKNKEYRKPIGKQIGTLFLILTCVMMAYFPQAMLYNLFGNYGESPYDFVVTHRLTIYAAFLFMIIAYASLRSRPQEDKNLFFVIMALAGLFQYFYVPRSGWAGLPLHLCNTAIIMMFFSFVFKMKGVFYFSYFVNVLGALCAIIFPNFTSDLFDMDTLHFWFNHIYAFTLPILGVALRVFPRPNLKMMYKAIYIFTAYFVLVAILNAWFNNYESTDYFFLYGDFFTSKINAEPFQNQFILDIYAFGLRFRFFWLYQLLVYVVFIVLMFINWSVYDALFRVSDQHYDLMVRRRMRKQDMLKLRETLGGKSMKDLNVPITNDMIKITHFSKRYGTSKTKAVDDFSLTIHAGEVFGFLGHNGAGKSTTIKSLVGIQSITEGEILVAGYNIKLQPLEAKLNIGYVSDNHAVYERLTGREYINYVADLYMVNQQDRDERLKYYLNRFSLTEAIDNEIKSYSHGMKQKLVVIASLIHNPKVWILDEPLTGLDPTSSFQIKDCMREHANKGNTVFFSSHVIEVVEKICDRIAIISHGKLDGIFSINELRDKGESLEDLYMKYVDKPQETR